ncbi:MAG: STAS domain-containing protein [Chloroflexi bacterium]|nr:STAS domain-containing protein [Chloroflexota bacterium]
MEGTVRISENLGLLTLNNGLSASLEQQLQDVIRQTTAKIIILDFSQTDSFDDHSLSTLVRLHNTARHSGKRLLAARLDDKLDGIFKLARLNEGIAVFNTVREAAAYAGYSAGLPAGVEAGIQNAGQRSPAISGYAWPGLFTRLSVRGMPSEAINLNVNGRRVTGPLQGFGQLWQKTYTAVLKDIKLSPVELIEVLKTNFTRFQPSSNRFYPGPAGIKPGEIILINADTPGGLIVTGVMVLYASETSFTFITPEGHPESGWVTFSAEENDGGIIIQIQGLARASDPLYEVAFRLAGSKLQQGIWTHVLQSLLRYVGSKSQIEVAPLCLDKKLQWSKFFNIFANAQVFTILNMPLIFLRKLIRRKSI